MPTYSYACTECGYQFDIRQAFSDDALTICPECTGKLRKIFYPVGVVFKGSGFYSNDSRKSKETSRSAAKPAGSGPSEAASAESAGTGSSGAGSAEAGSAGAGSAGAGSSGTSGSSAATQSSPSAGSKPTSSAARAATGH